MESEAKIRIGISACLLGERVRYDGGHKHDAFLTGTLGRFFEWVPVCPEVELGLGTPRESIRLEGDPDNPRLVAPRSGKDHTEAMNRYAAKRLEKLAPLGLCGYILKKDSPSCGMARVRVYDERGMAARMGRGLFAGALMKRFPMLPVEEEGRLHDMTLRENFIERVFALHRWREFLKGKPRAKDLVAFHTCQKLALMAHRPAHYQKLGRLVAGAGRAPLPETLTTYGATFMEGLAMHATTRKHANVLYHLAGYLKDALDAGDKAELAECIEDYRAGRVPLIVPLTLLNHHFRRHPHPWVAGQTYLNPYPAELMLRNHV
ncbi:MAG: DUF523 and DUF1722 domain-containing protein [Verrucomicrobiae bacterium]|nr:DUF523 and DUF1722 domain-containing protein [Verrucomicrobiae bacterium]